jgi:hypothetical protein
MRLRNKLAASAAAGLMLAGGLAAAGSGTASATTTTTIGPVTADRATVALDGLNTLPVTWTVHINDPAGMQVTPILGVQWWYPRLVLQKVSGTGWVPQMVVSLCPLGEVEPCPTSTTSLTSGDWVGTIQVPSTASGVWTVAGIWVSGPPSSPTLIAPTSSPTLTVTGLDIPALSVGFTPNPVHYKTAFEFKGSLYDSTTHKLFFGVVNVGTVLSPTDDECFNGNGHGAHEFFSKANGYGAPIAAAQSNGPVHFCLDVLQRISMTPNSDGLRQEIIRRLVYPPTATNIGGTWPATKPPLTARTGTTITVSGQAIPAQVWASGCTAYVEYLFGRTAFRPAGPVAFVRSSGRITLTYVLRAGRVYYKLIMPPCGTGGAWLESTSKPVLFTGT